MTQAFQSPGAQTRVCVFASIAITMQATATIAHTRDIKHTSIVTSGLSQDKATIATDDCKQFIPTPDQTRSYFSKAYPVNTRWSINTYYSPCYAEGTIEFSDGNRGTWILKSSGIGGIDWEQSGSVTLFHGKNPWYDPFEGMYGEDDGD